MAVSEKHYHFLAVKEKQLSGRFSPAYICADLDKTAIELAFAENGLARLIN